MGGTKFFVLQMKDLIRVGAIVLLGLVLIILALVFLFPSRRGGSPQESNPGVHNAFVPGTYASTIILNDKPIEVRVSVSETEILSIYMTDMAEIQRIFYPLFEPQLVHLAEEVLHHQSVFIEPTTDWPVTTSILQQAVKAALDMAVLGVGE